MNKNFTGRNINLNLVLLGNSGELSFPGDKIREKIYSRQNFTPSDLFVDLGSREIFKEDSPEGKEG